MYKIHLKRAGLNAFSLHYGTGISLEDSKGIYANSKDPRRGDVLVVDRACGMNGALVLEYCCTRCPEGKYLGLEFPDIPMQEAGLSIIKALGEMDKLEYRIAELVLQCSIKGNLTPESDEIRRALTKLRINIQAIELGLRAKCLPATERDRAKIMAYMAEKTACGGTQTVSGA